MRPLAVLSLALLLAQALPASAQEPPVIRKDADGEEESPVQEPPAGGAQGPGRLQIGPGFGPGAGPGPSRPDPNAPRPPASRPPRPF